MAKTLKYDAKEGLLEEGTHRMTIVDAQRVEKEGGKSYTMIKMKESHLVEDDTAQTIAAFVRDNTFLELKRSFAGWAKEEGVDEAEVEDSGTVPDYIGKETGIVSKLGADKHGNTTSLIVAFLPLSRLEDLESVEEEED